MVKRILKNTTLSILVTFSFTLCDDESSPEDADSIYSASNIPIKFTVHVPKSLEITGNGELSVKPGAKYYGGDGADCFSVPDNDSTNFGYSMVKSTVCQMQDRSKALQLELMLLDTGYDDIVRYIETNGNPVPAGAIKVGFTEPMRNLMADQFGSFLSDEEIDLFMPAVGRKVTLPELTYVTGEDGAYGHELTYKYFEIDPADEPDDELDEFGTNFEFDLSTKVLWNSSQTKILIDQSGSFSGSIDDSFGGTDTYRDEFSTIISFDARTGTMKFNDRLESDSAGSSFNFGFSSTMRECGAHNCLEVENVNESEFDDGFGGLETFTDKAFGIADDFGGFIESVFKDSFSTLKYRENFDGEGNLLNVCCNNGTGYTSYGSTNSECNFEDDEYIEEVIDEDEPIIDFGFTGVTVSGLGSYTGLYFLVVPDGDPLNNPADIVGVGYFEAADSEFNYSEYYSSDESEIPNLEVWYETFDETDFTFEFTEIPGAIVSQ